MLCVRNRSWKTCYAQNFCVWTVVGVVVNKSNVARETERASDTQTERVLNDFVHSNVILVCFDVLFFLLICSSDLNAILKDNNCDYLAHD